MYEFVKIQPKQQYNKKNKTQNQNKKIYNIKTKITK